MRSFCLLLGIAAASAARLRTASTSALMAAGNETSPFAALISEFQLRSQQMGSANDPHSMLVHKRLVAFRDAVHHMALQKAHHTKQTAKKTKATKAQKKEDEDPVGRVFEHIEDDKTCPPGGLMSTEKGVTAPGGCKELCAAMPGCVAFAFSMKPFKQCEFFTDCEEKVDANKIRKYSLYGILEEGEIVEAETCGELQMYPNSKPKNFGDMAQGMASEPKAFVAGDKIKYKCDREKTTDGSKDGPTEFEVECAEQGYFQPERHGCVGASECGPMPCIRKAHPTGKVEGSAQNPRIEMVCDDGYSLDGEKVVPGGTLKNALMYIECLDIGKWSAAEDVLGKKGKECQPFAFVPASNMIKMYNRVFEVLFIASCNTELTKWAEMEEKMPPKLEDGTVCGENVAEDKSGDCESLVDDLKTLFEDAKGAGNEGFDAKEFCQDMWNLLKMDEPVPLTEC